MIEGENELGISNLDNIRTGRHEIISGWSANLTLVREELPVTRQAVHLLCKAWRCTETKFYCFSFVVQFCTKTSGGELSCPETIATNRLPSRVTE